MRTEKLSDRARGRWPEIFAALAPHSDLLAAIQRGPRKHGRCPVHGGKHGDAFRIDKQFVRTGLVRCNTCGPKYGFSALMWLNGWYVQTTARRLGQYLDGGAVWAGKPARGTPDPHRLTHAMRAPEKGRPLAECVRCWNEAVALTDPRAEPVNRYLLSRRLGGLSELPSLRAHPSLEYFEPREGGGYRVHRFPAMLAQVLTVTGRLVGLHRTYLTLEGTKAPITPAKKLLNVRGETLAGSAVQLFAPGPILGVAEGIETALAVHLATGMPVWAATSAALLGSLIIPKSARRLVIWADYDELVVLPNGNVLEPGRAAALRLGKRLSVLGQGYDTVYPSALARRGVDWNDVWCERGAGGFPTLNSRLDPFPSIQSLWNQIRAKL